MNKSILGCLLALALAGGALAAGGDERPRPKQTPNYDIAASRVIGKPVENVQGEQVGKVEDLVIAKGHRASYAVLSVGGFLGVGQHMVAVPIDRLQLQGDKVLYDITREQLGALPEFEYREEPKPPRTGPKQGQAAKQRQAAAD